MNIVIRDLNNASENIEAVRFPCDEGILNKICDSLGIKMTTESNCYILDSSDKDFLRIIPDNLCNIDELNYLTKRLDGFGPKEIKQFYAVAFAGNPKTMTELINLMTAGEKALSKETSVRIWGICILVFGVIVTTGLLKQLKKWE